MLHLLFISFIIPCTCTFLLNLGSDKFWIVSIYNNMCGSIITLIYFFHMQLKRLMSRKVETEGAVQIQFPGQCCFQDRSPTTRKIITHLRGEVRSGPGLRAQAQTSTEDDNEDLDEDNQDWLLELALRFENLHLTVNRIIRLS
jgi:hypothetical protein